MKPKISDAEFKKENYKIILKNCNVFTEMVLYPLWTKVKKQYWRHSSVFENRFAFGDERHLFLFFCSFSMNV